MKRSHHKKNKKTHRKNSNKHLFSKKSKRRNRKSKKIRKTKKGGSKNLAFVGNPYNINNSPPGNYYELNKNVVPLPFNTCPKQKGGNLMNMVPDDLLNLGRYFKQGIFNSYNDFYADKHGPSYSVMNQPIDKPNLEILNRSVVNIPEIKDKSNLLTVQDLQKS
jgi:hypothetical protein